MLSRRFGGMAFRSTRHVVLSAESVSARIVRAITLRHRATAILYTGTLGGASCLALRNSWAQCEVQDRFDQDSDNDALEIAASSITSRTQQRAPLFACIRRLFFLALYGIPLLVLLPLCKIIDHGLLWEWYRRMCVESVCRFGATAVKLAQWAASRKDLFGEEMCGMLPSELHTNVESSRATESDLEHVRQVCAQSGAKLMDSEPLEEIGSGCIANVFKSRREDGTPVVVKILRGGTRRRMEADLVLLEWLVKFAHKISPALESLCLDEALREFNAHMQLQTDLSVEGMYLERMRRNFRNSAYICLPEVHGKPTGEVLVQSYVGGHHLADLLAEPMENNLLRDPQTRKLVSLELGRAFCKMLFIDNFTHLDLHPGNIKVCFSRDPRERRFSLVPDWLWQRMPALTAIGLTDPADNKPKLHVPLPILGLADVIEAKWLQFTGAAAFKLVLLDTGMALSMPKAKMGWMRTTCGYAVQGDIDAAGRSILEAHQKMGRVRTTTQSNLDNFIIDIGILLVASVRYSGEWRRFFSDYKDYIKAGTAEYLSIAVRIFSVSQVRVDPEIYCAVSAVALVEGSMRTCFKECSIARCALPFLLPNMSWFHKA